MPKSQNGEKCNLIIFTSIAGGPFDYEMGSMDQFQFETAPMKWFQWHSSERFWLSCSDSVVSVSLNFPEFRRSGKV